MTKDSSQQTKSTMELDISHQEVRILAKDSLDKLSVTHFNGSYNYFKGY